MSYRQYVRLEGWCSIVLGLALALVAFPGLIVSYDGWAIGLLFVPAVLMILGGWASWRRGVPLFAPGRWLTEKPLADARAGRDALDGAKLRTRLLVETGLWIVGVTAWVALSGSSGLLIFGTGLASAAFGAVQAFAAYARVRGVEERERRRYVVARRPGLGLPELGLR